MQEFLIQRNCKSGRNNQSHTFRGCNSQLNTTSIDIPYNGLNIKGMKNGKTKTPSPCRGNRMLRAINFRQDNTLRGSTKMKLSVLPFNGPNLCNDYLLKDSEYIDCYGINFPCHHELNQIDSWIPIC